MKSEQFQMKQKYTNILFTTLIGSTIFLFDCNANAGLMDEHKLQNSCTWESANYAISSEKRLCLLPGNKILTVSEDNYLGMSARLNQKVSSSRHNERRIEVWEKEGNKLHLYTCDVFESSSTKIIGSVIWENPNNWECKSIIQIRTSAFKIDQEYKTKELERKKWYQM